MVLPIVYEHKPPYLYAHAKTPDGDTYWCYAPVGYGSLEDVKTLLSQQIHRKFAIRSGNLYEKEPNQTLVTKTPKELREMSMEEYAEQRNAIRSQVFMPAPKVKPATKAITSNNSYPFEVSRKEEKGYEEAYWRFVNADIQEAADRAMKTMLTYVTMDLQPRPDGKSWVEEPVAKVIPKVRSELHLFIAQIFYAIGMIFILSGAFELLHILFI